MGISNTQRYQNWTKSTENLGNILFTPLSKVQPMMKPISMKQIIAERNQAKIFYTKFHKDSLQNIESMCRKSLTHFNKV
jgi:hypothetical protein